MSDTGEPRVEIVVQPKTHGQRFRYKCESRSAGCLIGDGSTNDSKIYPTVEVKNLNAQSAIIVVSCVTKDPPYYPHPHNLVGSGCNDGVCTIRLKPPQSTAILNGVGIQCCKRGDVQASLAKRQELRVNPFGTNADPREKPDLSVVRLCFQAFLPDSSKKFTRILQPVVTNPIIDKKTVRDLIIVRLSLHSGTVKGGDEMIILCEKVRKDDIQVRFFEQSPEGDVLWEEFADQSSIEVHHQYAIVFKTPAFYDTTIQHARPVFIQLYRPSTNEVGDAKAFQYQPADQDPYGFVAKRKKAQVNNPSNLIPLQAASIRLVPPTLNQAFDEGSNSVAGTAAPNLPFLNFAIEPLSGGPQRRTVPSAAPSREGIRLAAAPSATAGSAANQRVGGTYLPTYSYDNIGGAPPNGSVFMDDQSAANGRFIMDDSQVSTNEFNQVLNLGASFAVDTALPGASAVPHRLNDVPNPTGAEGGNTVLHGRSIDSFGGLDHIDENMLSFDEAFALQSAELSGSGLEDIFRQLNSGNLPEVNASLLGGLGAEFVAGLSADVPQTARDASNTQNT